MERANMVLDLMEQARKEERSRACRLVRKHCAACVGTGINIDKVVLGDDGEGHFAECEYCGLAIHAIMED